LGLAVAYAGFAAVHFGGQATNAFFVDWVYDGVAAVAVVLCAWRAVRVRRDRAVWALIAVAFVFEVAGNTVDSVLYGTTTTPVPSAADVFWAAFYVPMIGALALRVRAAASVAGAVIIDILIATCALGSISAAFVLEAILASGSPPAAELITTLAYPVADLVLVALVLQLAAAGGWRLGRATGLMAACFVVWAVTDTVYAFEVARGTYVDGGLLDLGWVVPYALFGLAAWLRPDRPATADQPPGWRALMVPVGFGTVAVVMVVYSAVTRINLAAVGLATGALVFVLARFVVTFHSYLAALRRTRLILETAPDAFISFDARGLITDWNPQAQASFGWSREQVIGRDLAATILVDERRDDHRRRIARFLAGGDPGSLGGRVEQTVVHQDGHRFPIESTISALETDAGYAFSVFARDITGRRRAQEELARARDDALEASRMKSLFVANVSHEIRTPLNGVIGMAEVLLDTRLDPAQRECAETISLSGETLLGVIEDILDFSKIEAGRFELDPTDFDPAAAIERSCRMLAPRAHDKGVELRVAIAPELPALVHGDAARLRQVITNLVSNAVKFTQHGEVAVRATAGPVHDGRALMRVDVSDTGIGIEPDALARLFTPFSQADSSTTRKYGGTGLGLAISRQLIELMGGRLGADSQPGRGSRFWFELSLPGAPAGARPDDQPAAPADRRETPPAPAPAAAPAPVDGRAPCVLVVEDTSVNQTVAARMLERCGYRAQIAGNGREALEALTRSSFAAVLMDCQMPELDGYETTREIRRREHGGRRLPIIAMTASSMPGDRERCLDAGMDDYLTKPLRGRPLADALSRWITRAPAEAAGAGLIAEPAPGDGGVATGPALLDRAILAELGGLGPDLLADVVSLYFVEAARSVSELRHGIGIGDVVSVARAAHTLKGASATVGATHVAHLAATLELTARAGDLTEASAILDDLRRGLDETTEAFGDRATAPTGEVGGMQ
jgi:PAS domain S-box-containing protein